MASITSHQFLTNFVDCFLGVGIGWLPEFRRLVAMARMYLQREKISCLVALALCATPFAARPIVFTSDATLSPSNTNYDGLDVIVSNCTLTVDGPHTFSN